MGGEEISGVLWKQADARLWSYIQYNDDQCWGVYVGMCVTELMEGLQARRDQGRNAFHLVFICIFYGET